MSTCKETISDPVPVFLARGLLPSWYVSYRDMGRKPWYDVRETGKEAGNGRMRESWLDVPLGQDRDLLIKGRAF